MRIQSLFVGCAVLALLECSAFAGVITGRVVDSNGVGVANVNISADFASGGGNPTVANGGTDANGFFATTITPNGVFDLTFTPPAPPTSTHLVREMLSVSVVGTVALGDVVLPAGVELSGRVVNSGGLPVADVNLDVLDANGSALTVSNDFSDIAGFFHIAVPAQALTLRLDPSSVLGQVLAPREVSLNLSGPTNLGSVVLSPGYVISGFTRRTNLTAVADVDVDVYDTASGAKLFTPGDDSSASGAFAVVVPAGIFDVRFTAPISQSLVSAERANLVVGANQSLGDVILSSGVLLSGVVQAFNGIKYAGVDVDVEFAANGLNIVLSNDNTDAAGFYRVVVPTGTLRVRFAPPYSLPLASQIHGSVVVNANHTLNGTLPSCPFFTNSGSGTAGTGGFVPTLTAEGGAPRLGNPDYALKLTLGRGRATAIFAWSPATTAGPVFGSNAWSAHGGYRAVVLSGANGAPGVGEATVAMPIGATAWLAGRTITARAHVLDPQSPVGKALTPYLHATLQL